MLLIDELSMGLAPIIVEELYEHVRRIAAAGLSILIVEQFAHEILGVADRAGIMLHGRIVQTGPPARSPTSSRARISAPTRDRTTGRSTTTTQEIRSMNDETRPTARERHDVVGAPRAVPGRGRASSR